MQHKIHKIFFSCFLVRSRVFGVKIGLKQAPKWIKKAFYFIDDLVSEHPEVGVSP
jgi:hypothetical protein